MDIDLTVISTHQLGTFLIVIRKGECHEVLLQQKGVVE